MRIDLGSNLIEGCDAALVVNGEEVFRLRGRGSDGRLVCDFDVRDQQGGRIAKIANSRVVYVADGYEVHELPRAAYVSDRDGNVVAGVQELGQDFLVLTGDFWIDGHHVVITEDVLVTDGAMLAGNEIRGFGKAISLKPGSLTIGTR